MNQIGGGQTRRRLELALTWFHLTFDVDIVARAHAAGCARALAGPGGAGHRCRGTARAPALPHRVRGPA